MSCFCPVSFTKENYVNLVTLETFSCGIYITLISWRKKQFFCVNKHSIKIEDILKFFLRSATKSPKLDDQTFFLTHRKTKNPRSKKFRHMRFVETFNI